MLDWSIELLLLLRIWSFNFLFTHFSFLLSRFRFRDLKTRITQTTDETGDPGWNEMDSEFVKWTPKIKQNKRKIWKKKTENKFMCILKINEYFMLADIMHQSMLSMFQYRPKAGGIQMNYAYAIIHIVSFSYHRERERLSSSVSIQKFGRNSPLHTMSTNNITIYY